MRYKKANLYKSRNESEEFGAGKKGLIICPQCQAVYFKKHWHHSLEKLNLSESLAVSSGKKDKTVKFELCPACQMIKNRQYEGEVRILNAPIKLKSELLNFIKGFCHRAYERDPMDRLIEIKQNGANWTVTVTENELANKLGKKIQHLYSNAKTKTVFSREPGDVARVVVEFLSPRS